MHGNPVDVGTLQKVVLLDCFRKKGVEGLAVFYSPIVGLFLAFAIYSASETWPFQRHSPRISKPTSARIEKESHDSYVALSGRII